MENTKIHVDAVDEIEARRIYELGVTIEVAGKIFEGTILADVSEVDYGEATEARDINISAEDDETESFFTNFDEESWEEFRMLMTKVIAEREQKYIVDEISIPAPADSDQGGSHESS